MFSTRQQRIHHEARRKRVSEDSMIALLPPNMDPNLNKRSMVLSQVSELPPLKVEYGISIPSQVTYVPPANATHLPLPTPPETLAQPLHSR